MSRIPRALRNDLQDDGLGQSQFVETRKIQPTSGSTGGGSQGQIRFILPKQGILDKDSYISFQVLQPPNNPNNYTLPIGSGAYSVLDVATLYCGGYQVQQTRGLGHLLTMKQYYRTPHDRDKKQSIRNGCFLAQMVDTNIAGVPGRWGIDNTQTWTYEPPGVANQTLINFGYRITASAIPVGQGPGWNVSPEWRIYLADLFPLLYNENLPLGLLDDEMSIVIDLGPDNCRGERTIRAGGNWRIADGNSVVINPTLNVDLIFYDDPIGQPTTMDEMRTFFESGERLVFTDNAFIQSTQPTAGQAGVVVNNILLGLDHQVVRHILMATPILNDYAGPNNTAGNALLGQYCSMGSALQNTLQININNQPVFPNELDSDNKIFNQLSQVFPTPFKVNSAMSSFVGQVDAAGALVPALARLTDKQLEAQTQIQLIGQSHYYGVSLAKTHQNVLNAGTSIGRQPVELVFGDTKTAADLTGRQLLIWANCERLLSIVKGKISVSGS